MERLGVSSCWLGLLERVVLAIAIALTIVKTIVSC